MKKEMYFAVGIILFLIIIPIVFAATPQHIIRDSAKNRANRESAMIIDMNPKIDCFDISYSFREYDNKHILEVKQKCSERVYNCETNETVPYNEYFNEELAPMDEEGFWEEEYCFENSDERVVVYKEVIPINYYFELTSKQRDLCDEICIVNEEKNASCNLDCIINNSLVKVKEYFVEDSRVVHDCWNGCLYGEDCYIPGEGNMNMVCLGNYASYKWEYNMVEKKEDNQSCKENYECRSSSCNSIEMQGFSSGSTYWTLVEGICLSEELKDCEEGGCIENGVCYKPGEENKKKKCVRQYDDAFGHNLTKGYEFVEIERQGFFNRFFDFFKRLFSKSK